MGALQSVTIGAPSKGMDLESAPAYVDNLRAPLIQNLMPARAGRLPIRGSILTGNPAISCAVNSAAGVWSFDNKLLLPTSGTNLGTTIFVTSTGTGALTSFGTGYTAGTRRTIGISHARLGTNVYGIGTDAAIASPAFATLLKWDGGSVDPTSLVSYINAPRGGVAVKTHLNRIFMLATNGVVGGDANTLLWSDDGGPTADTAAMWQDDVTGLANKIELPKDGERCVALAAIGRNLLILRSASLWMLTGSSPDTFDVRRVASIGCSSVQSVVEYNDGVFFGGPPVGQAKLYYYDGSSVKCVSQSLRTAVQFNDAARLDAEYIVAGDTALIGDPVNAAARLFLYHVPTDSWSEMTSNAFAGKPSNVGRTTDWPFLVEAGSTTTVRVWSLQSVTRPELNAVQPANDVGVPSGGSTPFDVRMTTRFAKLSAPQERVQLRSLMVDYVLDYFSVTTTTTWRITGLDDTGATVFTTDVAGSVASVVGQRRRAVVDVYGEVAGSIQIDVQLIYSGRIWAADIQDITLVYQTTRQRTG